MTAVYRKNAGIVVFNKDKKVLLCQRVDLKGQWQFPQGGINDGEDLGEAAKRELFEETGINSVNLVMTLEKPIRYDYPPDIKKRVQKRGYNNLGQEQFWSLFYFFGTEEEIVLDGYEEEIEFKDFEWVDLEEAVRRVVDWKREAYGKMAALFGPAIDAF